MEGEVWEYILLSFVIGAATLAIGGLLSLPLVWLFRIFRRRRKINYLPREVRRRRYKALSPCKACDAPGATGLTTFNGGAQEWLCRVCRNWFHGREFEKVDPFPDIPVRNRVLRSEPVVYRDAFHSVGLLESRVKQWGLLRNEGETDEELRVRLGAHVFEECEKWDALLKEFRR